MHLSEFSGGAALDELEHPHEGRGAGKAGLDCDLRDGGRGLRKELLGVFDALHIYISVEGLSGKLLEKPGKMVFGETGHLSDFL